MRRLAMLLCLALSACGEMMPLPSPASLPVVRYCPMPHVTNLQFAPCDTLDLEYDT
jgi:hypothetical protein